MLYQQNFHPLGNSYLSLVREPFSTLTSIQISGLPGEFSGQIGVPDHTREDITTFLPLWANAVAPDQIRKMSLETVFPAYLDESGLWMEPNRGSPGNLRLPDFLAAQIIEGVLDAGYPALAMEVYRKHFLSSFAAQKRLLETGRIESLIPVTLFLRLLGVKEISEKELVLQSFNALSEPVTVQYGQIEITINPNSLSLSVPGEDPLIITTSEPQRVRLGQERRQQP
jgi:hypothetical protein